HRKQPDGCCLNTTFGYTSLLNFLLHYETDSYIEHFVDEMLDYQKHSRSRYASFSILNPNLALLLGVARGFLRERFSFDSPMVQSGIVSVDEDGEITVLSRLRRLPYEPSNSTRQIQQMLFEKAPPSELEWRDFDHVESGRDHVEKLIVGALSTGEKGVNVLIHGPPGTGKTEFCKTLAERLDVVLYSVGESDQQGREPSRSERLQELRLTDRILGDARNSILLFDEMEDLLAERDSMLDWVFSGLRRRTRGSEGSKVFMHRLLEQNAVPILWTSNSARQTNPTLLRRMMYALELRKPSAEIRARIWRRQLERHGIPSADEDAESLANDFDVTPGVVERAVVGAVSLLFFVSSCERKVFFCYLEKSPHSRLFEHCCEVKTLAYCWHIDHKELIRRF
ncbi:MAG: AAA family ATPase, partial [Gammaproteobacteria bacterium]|nr:AAA family ATPase [Gammaproteobacteria bacterium]